MSASSRKIQAEINANKRFAVKLNALAVRVEKFREKEWLSADNAENVTLTSMASKLRSMAKAREGTR